MIVSILETYGEVLLQQHEGNRQIASALAEGARVSVRCFAKLLAAIRRHSPGKNPLS